MPDRDADEVESLTAARAGAMAGTEPSDGLRVRPTYKMNFKELMSLRR